MHRRGRCSRAQQLLAQATSLKGIWDTRVSFFRRSYSRRWQAVRDEVTGIGIFCKLVHDLPFCTSDFGATACVASPQLHA